MPRSVGLMGPPGSGKSTMIAKTVVNRPVYIMDIDRKIVSGGLRLPDVTVEELAETFAEDTLWDRVQAMSKNEKPKRQPMGWLKFSQMVDNLPKTQEALNAGTWALDSFTRIVDHLKRLLTHADSGGHANLSPRNYGSLLGMLEESTSQLIDLAKSHGKDLIVTVHEKVSELPGPNTKIVRSKDAQGNMVSERVGNMELRIAPSVEGQFAMKMASYFDEFYALSIEMDGDKPRWVCRVHPDGQRDLRTTLDTGGKVEGPCDFRYWWGDTTKCETAKPAAVANSSPAPARGARR